MHARSREVWAVLGLLALVAVLVVLLRSGASPRPVAGRHPIHTDPQTGEQYIVVGGVRRPATDLAVPASAEIPGDTDPTSFTALSQRIGKTQPVLKTANPMTRSVAQALETGHHPERLSVLADPAPFDNDAYQRNPQAYLNVVEPGRVWQSAQPGPDVPRLSAQSATGYSVEQGETVSLKVQAIALAPVTFTSFDLGEFQNQLTSITVAADGEGVAVARFTGSAGTVGEVNILAASPMTSGQVRFHVEVIEPTSTSGEAAVSSR